ncbi:MAG TPA: hypothetical protein VJ183_20005 [Chloroflexia bacterium]|nr:hypothetical protein [Chloroflexia bacterium]
MSSLRRVRWQWITLLLMFLAMPGIQHPASTGAQPQSDCRAFPETGMSVCGLFLTYWNEHGALAQQGLPLTVEFAEVSDTNGKTYTVQYFERAVFEKHPENKPPYDVLLSLLGNSFYRQKYPGGAPAQEPNTSQGSILFEETGKRLGGKFLDYWRAHGGLMQQGFPISNEFIERSELNNQSYRVQYFERAVFELHVENKPPFDVLLSQLGTYQVKRKYPDGEPDPWSALHQRTLKLPMIAPGSACPTSKGTNVAPEFGLAFGSGLIYAVLGAESDGIISYDTSRQEGGWFYHKVLWLGSPDFEGPMLVRGGQIDGPNELRFGDGANPSNELKLTTADKHVPGLGWTDWPTQTRIRSEGRYAFQVDATGFTEIIIFKAVENR